MGKSTISMAIFHSYVNVYQRVAITIKHGNGKSPAAPALPSSPLGDRQSRTVPPFQVTWKTPLGMYINL